MATKKRKIARKRKKRYKTGVYVSIKTGKECCYRSSWELLYFQHLDSDQSVTSFTSEPFKIPYVSARRTKNYIPDIIIEYCDGSCVLVEIKPSRKLGNKNVILKKIAGERWAAEHNATYKIITEIEIRALGLFSKKKDGNSPKVTKAA